MTYSWRRNLTPGYLIRPPSALSLETLIGLELRTVIIAIWISTGTETTPIYTLPRTNQLETLISLLRTLLNHSEAGFPQIKANWLQLVSYNDVKHLWEWPAEHIPGTDDAKDEKHYFIYTSAYGYMKPDSITESGLLSHDSISSLITIKVNEKSKLVVYEDAHTDGSFQALYSFLRIAKTMDPVSAFSTAQRLLPKANMIRVTTETSYEGYQLKKNMGEVFSSQQATRFLGRSLQDVISP